MTLWKHVLQQPFENFIFQVSLQICYSVTELSLFLAGVTQHGEPMLIAIQNNCLQYESSPRAVLSSPAKASFIVGPSSLLSIACEVLFQSVI